METFPFDFLNLLGVCVSLCLITPVRFYILPVSEIQSNESVYCESRVFFRNSENQIPR